MRHLARDGVPCPTPVPTLPAAATAAAAAAAQPGLAVERSEAFAGGVAPLPTRGSVGTAPLAARLLTWVDGETLSAASNGLGDADADALLEDAGRFLGRVSTHFAVF